MILLSAVCQIIRWFVKAPIQNTIYVALIKKATLLTASSYTENDLCSLLSCHLLKYIVHKPVSKAWSTTLIHAQNTSVVMLILAVSELSTWSSGNHSSCIISFEQIWEDKISTAQSIKINMMSTSRQAAGLYPLPACLSSTEGSTQSSPHWTMIQENTVTSLKITAPWCQHGHF